MQTLWLDDNHGERNLVGKLAYDSYTIKRWPNAERTGRIFGFSMWIVGPQKVILYTYILIS